MVDLMKHKSTCTLSSLINNSDIVQTSTVSIHNEFKNKVVDVVFVYH